MKSFLRLVYWNLPFFIFIRLYRLRNHDNHSSVIIVEKSYGLCRISDKNDLGSIYIAKRERIHKYHAGVSARLISVYNEYLLGNIDFAPGDLVIDIGANVGEVSMAIANLNQGIELLCIEPSTDEARCCDQNVFNGEHRTLQVALWSENTELNFYHQNETGDSSLLPAKKNRRKTLITAKTLDSVCNDLSLRDVKLIKLEAEGAEPEVLQGSKQILATTHYVSADLGPERGITRERTFAKCSELLGQFGFTLVGSWEGQRETFLFINSKFVKE